MPGHPGREVIMVDSTVEFAYTYIVNLGVLVFMIVVE